MAIGGFFRALMRPEIRRTCSKCGYTWTVPRYYTKHHLASGAATSSGGPTGYEGTGPVLAGTTTDRDMIAEQSEQWLEMKAQLARCAKCSSDRYTQKRIWTETRGEYEGDDPATTVD
jgi:predicted nucleic-acid-binding Zn-ribbon protein